jgi:hypothetical protein
VCLLGGRPPAHADRTDHFARELVAKIPERELTHQRPEKARNDCAVDEADLSVEQSPLGALT